MSIWQKYKRGLEDRHGVPAVAQWVNDPAYLCVGSGWIPGLAQWIKDLVLLQLWCRVINKEGKEKKEEQKKRR